MQSLKTRLFKRNIVFPALLLFCTLAASAQPANNDCSNASAVSITNNGFGIGAFNSSTFDLSLAAVQSGETFAPAILVAGQNQKSIWYKFTLPTTRSVRVTLAQPGTAITAGDAGFAVYRTSSCLPGNAEISTKLTPIGTFGNSFHPCVESGEYYVQVSGKAAANGPVYITVETGYVTSPYDRPAQAYDFGTLAQGTRAVNYAVECQSTDDAAETCTTLSNTQDYNKSTWHVFTTPNYFDYIAFLLSADNYNYTITHKYGYRLYKGDARVTPINSLQVIDGCDSLEALYVYNSWKGYRCGELETNTTYSVQLFFHRDFIQNVQATMMLTGTNPTQAPEPILAGLPTPTNNLGALTLGNGGYTNNITSDYFGCNSRHTLHPCSPSLPAAGIDFQGNRYTLSSFFTFTLSTIANLQLSAGPSGGYCGPPLLITLYNQGLSNNCTTLDTTNIISRTTSYSPYYGGYHTCLPPGTYTVQVSGTDTTFNLVNNQYYGSYGSFGSTRPECLYANLGTKFDLWIQARQVPGSSRFSLAAPGAFDTINHVGGVMQSLTPGIEYASQTDTVACASTVRPSDTTCAPDYNKVMYHEFNSADSGLLSFSFAGNNQWMKIYKGDANALAVAQNAFSYPQRISGLEPYTLCINSINCGGSNKACVIPGTYTAATFNGALSIGSPSNVTVRIDTTKTRHYSPETAENMGDILSQVPGGGTVASSVDYYGCRDNAVPINGFQPCLVNPQPATKAVYRQFYLSSPAIVQIYSNYYNPSLCYYGYETGRLTLFSGKATDGIAGLTVMPAPWQCFTDASTGGSPPCDYNYLPAGWYTVVSYGSGPSYENPLRDLNENGYSSYVGKPSLVYINVRVPTTCPGPKYNRPATAAIDTTTGQPFLLQWGPRAGHTAAYPKTDTVYTLYTENFNCTNDTPFVNLSLPCQSQSGNPPLTKVAYYIFRITQESFVQIDAKQYWGSVYAGNARTNASILSGTPIHPCNQNFWHQIQLCKLQPGEYTLALFAPSNFTCNSVTPTIYIDRVGYSRFDHANNAYDFGVIPPDSTYYFGKPGDVNPLDPGRAPSNDFFYCTTGAQQNDPADGSCYAEYLPNIYDPGVNIVQFPVSGAYNYGFRIPKRNLWYTFVADRGGWVRIKVRNRTIGKSFPYIIGVYKSNVNGTLSFSNLVSAGQVDSTAASGLSLIGTNLNGYYCSTRDEIAFYREPCTAVAERYYIVVENPNNYAYTNDYYMTPNSQVEIGVMMDSLIFPQPRFDHYYQANNIGSNLGPGTYSGATDNFTCATRDATDPAGSYTSCTKTLWYKFSVSVSGTIWYRVKINNSYQYGSYHDQIQLLKEITPGDSTSNGLIFQPYTNAVSDAITGTWNVTCISPGTYYFFLPGCGLQNEFVFPEFQIYEQLGDFCSRPVSITLNGAGSNVSSAEVSCHTIGTDYGEFNPLLTCPNGAPTNQYKTTWFRIDITGTDTLDVTTFLTENTNAGSSDIKYRLMNGNCGAMQERSCVQDALTQDTYKCLPPGSYWVQVFTPVTKNGSPVGGLISLNLNAVQHADTCAPINACLSNANFQMQYDCTLGDAVQFINYSTFGASVSYLWNFGYNGQTSTSVSPRFVYPASTTTQKYYITLTVTNNSCGGSSTYRDSIVIPAHPVVNLGRDTSLCNGGSVTLNAASFSGATYQWNTGANTPSITVTTPGVSNYAVTVTYNNCISRDTVRVNIDPVSPRTESRFLCGGDPAVLNASRGLNESYNWNTGSSAAAINVYTPGTYWCDINVNGCTTRDSFIVSGTVSPLGNDRGVCFGTQPVVLNATTQGAIGYSWQNGSTNATFTAPSAGLYWVDVVFSNCTLRDTLVLSVLQPATANASPTLCSGRNYTLPSGRNVSAAGTYQDTLRTAGGCDSLITTVVVRVQTASTQTTNARICPGQAYTLPWGTVVSIAGIYRDTLRYPVTGCDSLYRIVNLAIQAATTQTTNPTLCPGQTYTLPWGTVVSTAGTYRDTLRYTVSNCDSVYRIVNLAVRTAATQTTSTTICGGQSFTLPWGMVVTASGTYRDTLRYSTGNCDSVYRIVNLTVQSTATQTSNPRICAGQSYTLPWGAVVSTAGTYRDTLRYAATNCDSLYRIMNLSIQAAATQTTNPRICAGQSYTLPWGAVVSNAGTYRDTLRYSITNCDSLYRIVNLSVQNAATQTSNPRICAGQPYTLPWGAVVSNAGTYRDTLRYAGTGCDSVYRIVNLSVQAATSITTLAEICAGQSYTLPWGAVVSGTGTFRDTSRYSISNCDSLYRIVRLTVQNAANQISNPVICAGQSYTLPWGVVVATPGTYRDTIRYAATNCDSVYRVVNLIVQNASTEILNPVICNGQAYTLPSGTIVTTAGVYRDTLRYAATGCDSLYRIINLAVQSSTTLILNPVICAGQTYTLPWGRVVTAAGTYRDTLRHTGTNCDSVYRIVNLSVQTPATLLSNPAICPGQTFTLPWGTVVTAAGTYRDTLRFTGTNCDSLYRIVNLSIQVPATQNLNPVICNGQPYTLPWGAVVSQPGTYRDTLRYTNTACDSMYRIVNLAVQNTTTSNSSVVLCSGQSYTLPWGTVVSTAGTYRDTLRYTVTGCDSIYRVVTIRVQDAVTVSFQPTICSGSTYTLPWGSVVNTAGVYRDTLRYAGTGCDSLYRIVNLTVKIPQLLVLDTSICSNESYRLPWGIVVTAAGIYADTVKTAAGCDSLFRNVTVRVQPAPVITVSKSNDVNCFIGNARLSASGASTYLWSPAASLSDARISNPLASPTVTTLYRLEAAGDNGCIARDSILVVVNKLGSRDAYQLPNAFTPNGDGRNDCFGARHWGAVSNFDLSIFNRWGKLVYRTNDPADCWDGKYNGTMQPGTYVYVATGNTICGPVQRRGSVILIR